MEQPHGSEVKHWSSTIDYGSPATEVGNLWISFSSLSLCKMTADHVVPKRRYCVFVLRLIFFPRGYNKDVHDVRTPHSHFRRLIKERTRSSSNDEDHKRDKSEQPRHR